MNTNQITSYTNVAEDIGTVIDEAWKDALKKIRDKYQGIEVETGNITEEDAAIFLQHVKHCKLELLLPSLSITSPLKKVYQPMILLPSGRSEDHVGVTTEIHI